MTVCKPPALLVDDEPLVLRECYGLTGSSTAMQQLFAAIRRFGPYARTALITGETGAGKELVARALHKAGRRSDKRFVTINCSAVVESLFESELFGHVRGAFTGAIDPKPGLFEVADGGVLFLDEVGELPINVQAKLLRVLELGEFQRVGALEARRVDVQIVAATNRDLRAEVAAGRFRSDLYYRLNIVELHVPPLRDRREDIPDLAHAFLRDCAMRWARTLTGITPSAQQLLMDARWDGNVRELRNVMERACLQADGAIVSEEDVRASLPAERESIAQPAVPAAVPPAMPAEQVSKCASPPDAFSRLSSVEREHILRVLQHANGNKKVAARILGISRRKLYRRLDRLGLEGMITRRPSPASTTPGETVQS